MVCLANSVLTLYSSTRPAVSEIHMIEVRAMGRKEVAKIVTETIPRAVFYQAP